MRRLFCVYGPAALAPEWDFSVDLLDVHFVSTVSEQVLTKIVTHLPEEIFGHVAKSVALPR